MKNIIGKMTVSAAMKIVTNQVNGKYRVTIADNESTMLSKSTYEYVAGVGYLLNDYAASKNGEGINAVMVIEVPSYSVGDKHFHARQEVIVMVTKIKEAGEGSPRQDLHNFMDAAGHRVLRAEGACTRDDMVRQAIKAYKDSDVTVEEEN